MRSRKPMLRPSRVRSLRSLRSFVLTASTLCSSSPYTAALASDAHFAEVVAAISARARENGIVLIRRSAAMRHVAEQQAEAGRSRFELQNRGYHCTAEHVGLVVRLSLERFAGTK